MPLDPDLLPAVPTSDSEWLLQYGERTESSDRRHIEAVQDAIEKLDPQSRFCVEAIFYEGISYSKLGKRLGVSKPHAWRLARRAIAELERMLSTNHSINMRYRMYDNWDDASYAILEEWDHFCSPQQASIAHLNATARRLSRNVRNREDIDRLAIIDIAAWAVSQMMYDGIWNLREMHELLVSKQHDYGHDNINMFGTIGVAIRICDKLARLNTLTKSGETPDNEALDDTWRDLVGYATISEMLHMDLFNLDLKEDK